MMKKKNGSISSKKLLIMFKKLKKKKKNVVVMSLICVCSAQRKSDFPFLKDNIFLPYGNACKKGTNRTYSEVCLEETGINEHCIFGISV